MEEKRFQDLHVHFPAFLPLLFFRKLARGFWKGGKKSLEVICVFPSFSLSLAGKIRLLLHSKGEKNTPRVGMTCLVLFEEEERGDWIRRKEKRKSFVV